MGCGITKFFTGVLGAVRDESESLSAQPLRLHIPDFQHQALAQDMGCPRQGIERNRRVLRIKQAIQLRAARFQFGRHRPLRLLLPNHLLLKLPGEHALDRGWLVFPSCFTGTALSRRDRPRYEPLPRRLDRPTLVPAQCSAVCGHLLRVRLLRDGCSVGAWISCSKVDLTVAVTDDGSPLAYEK